MKLGRSLRNWGWGHVLKQKSWKDGQLWLESGNWETKRCCWWLRADRETQKVWGGGKEGVLSSTWMLKPLRKVRGDREVGGCLCTWWERARDVSALWLLSHSWLDSFRQHFIFLSLHLTALPHPSGLGLVPYYCNCLHFCLFPGNHLLWDLDQVLHSVASSS